MEHSPKEHKSLLPKSYVINENDVLCGRGKTCQGHIGSIRFRQIVACYVPEYITAATRSSKTDLLDTVVKEIHASGGAFLKFDSDADRYYEVDPSVAKSRVSQAFRDILQDRYRSSSGFRTNKRKIERTTTSHLRRRVQGDYQSQCLIQKCKDDLFHYNELNFFPNRESPIAIRQHESQDLPFPNNCIAVKRSLDSKSDALLFDLLLQIAMEQPTFHEDHKDSFNPQPLPEK